MNSWQIIRKEMTRPTTRPGSTGELVDINNASKVYIALRDNIKDQQQSDDSFNNDELVTKAIFSRTFLEGIGAL